MTAAYDEGFTGTWDFNNSWGSAAFVWDKLCGRYVPELAETYPFYHRWHALFRFHQDHDLDTFEHNTLVTTYDRHVVKRDDMLVVAKSFERFVKAFPPDGRACSLLEQAQAIRQAHRAGAEYLAWQQTSVGEPWFWTKRNEEDSDQDEWKPYDPHIGNDHIIAPIVPLAEMPDEDSVGE